LQDANALPGSSTMVFNRIQNPNGSLGDQVHDTGVLDIHNTGDQPLVISSYTLSTGWTLVSPPMFPLTVAAGASTTLTIKFVATTEPSVPYNETSSPAYPTGGGVYHGSLVLNSNDPNSPTATVPLAGWWQYHSENANEPSLQSIVNLLHGWTTNINSTPIPELTQNNSTTNSVPTYYGEEVVSAYWMEADPSLAVTVQEIAAYHTEGNTATTYWYTKGSGSHNKLFTTASDDGQTLFPYATGTTTPAAASFTSSGTFGFDLDGEFSDDSLNTAYPSAGGHHVRFYPLRDDSGNLIPNTYIMTMDYSSSGANFDFQDNVYIVNNIHPMSVPAAPTDFFASVVGTTSVATQWAPIQDTTLLGYNVYRASSASGTYTLLTGSPITATSYIDNSAPTGTTSYYKVTAVDSVANAESLGDISPAAVPAVIVSGSGDPVVTNQAATTQAGIAVTIYDLTSATDTGGTIDPSTVVVSTDPANGTTSVDPTTGNITYTPTADFSGTDTFQYTVADSTGAVSAPATITITVIAQVIGNPIAANLSETTAEGVPVTVNDAAAATDSIATIVPGSVLIYLSPTNGSVSVDPTTGNITYTPDAGFSGTDTIQYTIGDSLQAVSPVATITITVSATPVPTLPVISNLSAALVAGNSVTVDDVAAAIDSAGTLIPSTVTITQNPADGVAVVDPVTGKITYTPAAGFSGTDTLQYTITDSQPETSLPATITFTITPAPTIPLAANLTASTTTVTPVTINVAASASDPGGTVLPSTVTITQIPAHGTVTVDPVTGAITYTARAGFVGTDTIEYAISDNQPASSLPATITITVAAAPVIPVAATLASTTLVNGVSTVNVIASATAGAKPLDPASVTISTAPAHGAVSVDPATGSISYTPASNFVGVDTLQYTVADTSGNVSAPATLSFSVGVTINKTTAKSLTYTDANGVKITVALTNGGTAEVMFNGVGTSTVVSGPHGTGTLLVTGTGLSISGIAATGTTAISALNITHRGNTPITIGDISADGPLASITAPFANLTGDVTVNGILRRLTIGSATGATINAQQITSITATGNFDAALTISNAAASPFALGAVHIGGQIGAEAWHIAGNASSILTGSVSSGWTATFAKSLNVLTIRSGGFAGSLTAGSINSLSIIGNDTGSITAGRIQSARIVGSLSDASLHLTNALAARVLDLGHLGVTGATTNATIISAGNIGSITTAGISGSSIDAGTTNGVRFPQAGSGFAASATISAIQVVGRGSKFSNSDIAAQTIGVLNLGQIQTQNGGTPFGVAAGTISSFNSTLDSGGALHLNRRQLVSTAAITAYITSKDLDANDFVIRAAL
jgi:hypothetical protein